jgi:hypothetical protein
MDTYLAVVLILAALALPAGVAYMLYKKSQAEAKLNWFCPSCESTAQGVKK